MSRAMEWCGRTISSFVKFPAECSCIWAECRRGHSKSTEKDSAQTEAFNRGLQPDEQSVFLVQDDLAAMVEEALQIIHEADEGQAMRQLTIVENPRESWLWDFDLVKVNQWSGSVRERDPWKTSLGKCVMPGQAEEEVSARFVWQMAGDICRETARRLQFRLGILRSPALQPLVENNRAWWIAPPSNTVPEFMMVPTGLHLPYFHPAASFATHYHMSSSITVESLDLGEALVHEEEALATYRRLAEEAGLSERIATLLVNNMGYRTLEDLENVSEAQVENKSIQAIIDLDIPLVTSSRLEKLIKAIRGAAEVSLDQRRKGTVGDEDGPLPSEEPKRLESLLFSRYKLRLSADEDARKTVVNRVKRQLSKRCIRFENSRSLS